MNLVKKILVFLLVIFVIYLLFSIKAYFDYRSGYQDCERINGSLGVMILPDPKVVCSYHNSRLFWKILFPFGFPPYPDGIPI